MTFLKKVIFPLLASLFFIGFGGFFVFGGFQTVDIKLERSYDDNITALIVRSHFLGLVRFQDTIEGVKGVDYSTHVSRSASRTTSRGRVTGIYIYSDAKKIPLMTGASNTNKPQKCVKTPFFQHVSTAGMTGLLAKTKISGQTQFLDFA